MVLDSSAIVAIELNEPAAEELITKMEMVPVRLVGPPTLVEVGMVLTRHRRDAARDIAEFLRKTEIRVVPFTEEHFQSALAAFLRYGKGRHPAALNLGDCMAYAVAKLADLPLLYTGDDFAKTDIRTA